MRIAIFILIVAHALIHLLGFFKAFKLLPLPQLPLQISHSAGLLWLLAGVGFLISAAMMIVQAKLWWAWALPALALSQFLLFQVWSEAKFGTIPNLIILAAALVAIGSWSFDRKWELQKQSLLPDRKGQTSASLVKEEDLAQLPAPLQNWLRWSGIIGKNTIQLTHLKQKGRMRLKPEQKEWIASESEQFISTEQRAFIWRVSMTMFGLPILGQDVFASGKGSVWISLMGLFPVVNVRDNAKTNQSALQRFLGEIMWTPSAALDPSIRWEAVDATTARATMSWGGTQGAALFYFQPDGQPIRFVAERFRDVADDKPTEWVAEVSEPRRFQGIAIPSKVQATWMLPEGPFTWFQFEIVEASFQ